MMRMYRKKKYCCLFSDEELYELPLLQNNNRVNSILEWKRIKFFLRISYENNLKSSDRKLFNQHSFRECILHLAHHDPRLEISE